MDHLLRKYSSLIEAEGARAYLEAHGVKTQIPDHHAISMQPHLISVFGGIRLMVGLDDKDKAEELISEVERRAHLTQVIPEDHSPLSINESNKKRAQVRNLARFVLLVFGIYYLIVIIKNNMN